MNLLLLIINPAYSGSGEVEAAGLLKAGQESDGETTWQPQFKVFVWVWTEIMWLGGGDTELSQLQSITDATFNISRVIRLSFEYGDDILIREAVKELIRGFHNIWGVNF